ncbi:MAG: hypothetical protein GYB37_04855 [Algicola sp.]|nr:hypothetical protein [Algicola sp.]
MKTTRFYTLFLYMAVLLLASCSEETVTGPQGETGETGPMGPQGIPGKDGALILFGNGAPTETLGNNGDMYLDRAGSELYGPKNDTGWGTPLQLTGEKGDQGDAGTPGSKFLSGTANPSTGEGAEGDYFLNQESGDLFGPKSASGWGTPINLKGTANVVASTWMDWKTWNGTNPYYREATYDIPAPILNAVGYTSLGNMLSDGGVFLVYFTDPGGYQQIPTPFIGSIDNWQAFWYARTGNFSTFYFVLESLGSSSLPPFMIDLYNGKKIRYVLIPAGIQINAAKAGEKEFMDAKAWQQMDYDEVKELLGLPD